MVRTRGRRLVSRLEALERVYDTRGPRVFRVIFEYGGEPTIVTIFRDENRTEITEPPPPDDDPDEFYGACESTEELDVAPAPQPDDETPSSFPVGANASLSIRRGTACRAHSPTRSRNGLRPFRVVRISKRSGNAVPHRGNLRHAKTSQARRNWAVAVRQRARRGEPGRAVPVRARARGLPPAALCGYVQQADCRARFGDLGSLLDQWASTASNCCFAAATTLSAVKPNFFWSSLSGAEAPLSTPRLPHALGKAGLARRVGAALEAGHQRRDAPTTSTADERYRMRPENAATQAEAAGRVPLPLVNTSTTERDRICFALWQFFPLKWSGR